MTKSFAHFQPAKPGSEEHNRRLKHLDYVRTDLSKSNQSWHSQSVASRLEQLKQLVKAKTGRAMQKKATPIQEAVVLIKPTTTMEDLKKLAAAWREEFGIDVFQIDIHLDEGHYNEEGKWVGNLHAHMTADFMDHETGKSLKPKRQDMAKLQDITAKILDMERGVSSNKQHLSSLQFKIQEQRKTLEALKKKVGPGAKLAAFFKVGELAEIRNTIDTAVAASKEAEAGMKEAKKALSDANEAHSKELASAREESRQRGASDALEAVKKAADLHITGKDGKETAEDIGKNWRWNFDQRKQLQSKVDSLEAEKKQLQSHDPFKQLNKVLQHFHISTLNAEDVEKAAAVIDRSYLGGWNAPARNDFCDAVIAWGRQKRELNNNPSPKALQTLRKLFEAMVEAWNYLMRVVRAPFKGGVISPGEAAELARYSFTPEAVMKEVQLQLELTPGAAECSDGWQEALKQTPEQFLAPYQSLVKLHSDIEQVQHDQEQHIEEEEEEEVKRTWGAKR